MDFFVSEYRDKDATKKFFKKALKSIHNNQPRVITTDKYAATKVAIYEMIYSGTLSVKTTLQKIKYLNNIIEQDHRFIKRKIRSMLGFDSFETVEKTICGIEIMHMIRKEQVEEIQCVRSEVEFFNRIMGVVA
ncbi:DDE-type integrase/transposase/recombinase [Pelosinus sp. sgz500959]|uniref:DDE-type integrase/transposase/recombinase n=1 Tax=Pelosinus sp. sgz500959 TaxID=3242472 RepID=UPI0036712188